MAKTFSISIDAKTWLAGAASSPYSPDGGFSPSLGNHNIDYQKGVIAPTDTPTKVGDLASGVNGCMFGKSDIWDLLVGVKSNGDIYYYHYEEGAITLISSDNTKNYSAILNMIAKIPGTEAFLISADTDISYLTTGGGGWDENWWTGTKGKTALMATVPHHFCVLGNSLYFCNGNKLNKVLTNETVVENILDISSSGELAISTICEHDDKIYMATEFNDLVSKGGYYLMAWVDDGETPASQLLDLKIPVDEKIYSMVSYLGYLWCFTEHWLMRWNGLYLEKVRPLNGAVYPNQICKASGNLYFVGGNDPTAANNSNVIQAFNGTCFWFPYQGTTAITGLGNVFGDDLAFCTNEDLNKTDLNDRVGSGQFATLPIDFIGNVFIRKITIELAENMASGNVNTFKIYDQAGALIDTLTMSYALDGAVACKEFKGLDYKNLNSMVIKADTFNNLIRRITVQGETSDMPL